MGYYIYELMENEDHKKSTGIFVVYSSIAMYNAKIGIRKDVEQWLKQNNLINFDLDNPHAKITIDEHNKSTALLNACH